MNWRIIMFLMKPEDLTGGKRCPGILLPHQCVCGECDLSSGVKCVEYDDVSELTRGMIQESEYLHDVQDRMASRK
jgi:hypothetical protein